MSQNQPCKDFLAHWLIILHPFKRNQLPQAVIWTYPSISVNRHARILVSRCKVRCEVEKQTAGDCRQLNRCPGLSFPGYPPNPHMARREKALRSEEYKEQVWIWGKILSRGELEQQMMEACLKLGDHSGTCACLNMGLFWHGWLLPYGTCPALWHMSWATMVGMSAGGSCHGGLLSAQSSQGDPVSRGWKWVGVERGPRK